MALEDNIILRISARQSMLNGQDHVNVWYALTEFSAPQQEADVLDAISQWLDVAYAEIESWIDDGQDALDIKVDVMEYVGGKWDIVANVGTTNWYGNYTPESTGDPLPAGNAVLSIFRTDVGKTFARKFIGGLTEPGVSGNNVVSAFITALVAMANDFLANYVVSTGNYLIPGVISYRDGEFHAFTEADVQGAIGYQRRRRPGTGS